MLKKIIVLIFLVAQIGCSSTSPPSGPMLPAPVSAAASKPEIAPHSRIEVAFSPEAGAEDLVIKVIDSSTRYIRLAGYTFTSATVVKALLAAKRRGVEVRVLIDDKGNRSKASTSAMNLIAGADIPLRVVSSYAIHHDKYIVVDGRHTEIGSFNFSQAAAKSNSENVIVIWDNPTVALAYFTHWESRWIKGMVVEQKY